MASTEKLPGWWSVPVTRRAWLGSTAAGVTGLSMSGWLEALAQAVGGEGARRRSCILLWMTGGPSQMDTFDLKPGTPNGGPYKAIETSVPGMQISEHLPKLARHGEKLVLIRSMSTKEGDHSRATALMRTGYLPQGPIRYPTLGALVAKELGNNEHELPNFVSINSYRLFAPNAFGPGFLGSEYDPLLVGDAASAVAADQEGASYELKVEDLEPPSSLGPETLSARLGLLGSLNRRFLAEHHSATAIGHRIAYERAIRLMRSEAGKVFDLSTEPDAVRDAYGRNRFGQGCLLARRLVERGVPFVEVSLNGVDNQAFGWDTHADNFEQVRRLSEILDPAWSTLLAELSERGLLQDTLVVWMGEFGRTPVINPNGGRDHYPQAWSTVLAGGGVRGGQIVGKTSDDGREVVDRPVAVADLLATICLALGIDPETQNLSNVGRPIRIVDASAKPIREILA
jgi:hypothetical protein